MSNPGYLDSVTGVISSLQVNSQSSMFKKISCFWSTISGPADVNHLYLGHL